jgi:cytoskeletal protein RodZ
MISLLLAFASLLASGCALFAFLLFSHIQSENPEKYLNRSNSVRQRSDTKANRRAEEARREGHTRSQ